LEDSFSGCGLGASFFASQASAEFTLSSLKASTRRRLAAIDLDDMTE
jgi:hypothetical protein